MDHPLQNIHGISCHDENHMSQELWSIQDFKVHIPASFQLDGYNIAAGLTRLSFTEKKLSLNICRIAPATIRLKQQSLKEILAALIGSEDGDYLVGENDNSLYYERLPSLAAQVKMRLQKKKPFCLAKLWHDSKSDRLLGVITESVQPLDTVFFNDDAQAMKFFKPKKSSKRPNLSRQEALRCVPVIHNSVNSTELDSGAIILEYPLPLKPLFQALHRRFSKDTGMPMKKLQLDEMGSIVWKQINGEDSTKTIISTFASQYGLTLQEAELSVTTFLVELGKRGLIAMR